MDIKFWNNIISRENRLIAACGSNRGNRRPNNEDNFYFDGEILSAESLGTRSCYTLDKALNDYNLLAVFDGMGGGDYGEVASNEAASTAAHFINSGEINPADITPSLNNMCKEMNLRVFERGCDLGAYNMGTTIVSLFFYSGQFWVCNVGDSRAFALRQGTLVQLSKDHTDAHILKDQGITNRKPYLTQYLGINPEETEIVPYIKSFRFTSGDKFLICSDGVTDMVSENDIKNVLIGERSPERAVVRLIDLALNNGGKDNITAIVCEIL